MIGSIYKFSSPNCIEYYIGSFNNNVYTLNSREQLHKSNHNTCNSKVITNFGDAYIELIEEYECNTIEDLRKREQFFINQSREQGHTLVNKINAYTSPEDRREYLKQWRINNPNYMKDYCKNWRQRNLRTN